MLNITTEPVTSRFYTVEELCRHKEIFAIITSSSVVWVVYPKEHKMVRLDCGAIMTTGSIDVNCFCDIEITLKNHKVV